MMTKDILGLPINRGMQPWLVAIGGGIAGIIMGLSRHILPVVFPYMKSTIQMNYKDLGILTSGYFCSYMISSFILGHYSDKIGGKKIVLFGSLLCGIMIIGIGFSNHFITALLFSIAIGVGAGGIHVPMISIVLKWFKNSKRGLPVSIYSVGEGVLSILIGIIIPLIILTFSWRFVWWFFGMFSILLTIGLLILIKDKQSEGEYSKVRPDLNVGGPNFLKIITIPKMFRLSFIYLMQAITRGVFMTFIVIYLIKEGMPFKIASGAFSSIGFGFIPGTVLSGIASDKFRRTHVLAALLFIETFSIGSILLIQKVIPIYFLVAMVGFCLIGVPTVMATIPSEYYDSRIYGKVLGFLTFVYGIGVTLSPYIGGAIADLSGSLTLTLLVFGVGASIIAGMTALSVK